MVNLQEELDYLIDSTEIPFLECELFSENAVYLQDCDALLQFARQQNIASLFYMFDYYYEEDYIITEEMLKGWDTRLREALRPHMREHNAEVGRLDFAQPCGLDIFCLHEGFAVIAGLDDDWMDGEELATAEEALRHMVEQAGPLLGQIASEREQDRLRTMERLSEHILRDPEFPKCTNQRLRLRYIVNLLRRMPEFRAAFRSQQEYTVFIDALWKEYKHRQ